MRRPELGLRVLTLPQDSGGFIRRECPHCRGQFKTRPFPSDGASVQRAFSSVIPHQNQDENGRPCTHRACLYCGRTAPPDEWLTAFQREYLDKIARAYAREVRFEQLSYVGQTLAQNPRPTFVPISPERINLTLPPEPDDLEALPLLCCSEEAKCCPSWSRPIYCPRCGAWQQSSKRTTVRYHFIRE